MRSKNERGNAVTSTSTAVQSRVVLYQPSQRPTLRTGEWMETSYGRCRVTGRLGQRHADVLEAIMYCAEKTRTVSDGGVELLVDPAQIRKTLSDSRYSFKQIEKLIVDLRVATITICRIPDDRIDSRRSPLFMARAVMAGLIEQLESSRSPSP